MLLEERTHFDAPPEAVFRFFTSIEQRYRARHPDHVTFQCRRRLER